MKVSQPARIALWSAFGISAGLLALWWVADHRRGLAWAMAVVKDRFPDVPQLSAALLAETFVNPQQTRPLLLDARSAEEFGVSHLANAQRLDPATPDAEIIQQIPKDRPIVVYCAAGYRGSQMARRLRALGYADVANLSGGIFQWANEGREIYRGDQLIREVHSFHAAFRRLLRREARH
jgi:rhodanese-related sulfurtransferase